MEIRVGPMGGVSVEQASADASSPILLRVVEDDFAPARAIVVLTPDQACEIAAELLQLAKPELVHRALALGLDAARKIAKDREGS